MDNVSTIQAAPFRTLIAAKDARFPAPFRPPPPSAAYYPKFGGSLASIIPPKGAAWDVDELPAISVEFRTMSLGS